MSSTTEQASELRDQLRVIRSHKWQIALITLLVTGTALFEIGRASCRERV